MRLIRCATHRGWPKASFFERSNLPTPWSRGLCFTFLSINLFHVGFSYVNVNGGASTLSTLIFFRRSMVRGSKA